MRRELWIADRLRDIGEARIALDPEAAPPVATPETGAGIVYSIRGMNGPVDAGLAVRNFAEPEMRLIPRTLSLGTLVAPTFSPDGQVVASRPRKTPP